MDKPNPTPELPVDTSRGYTLTPYELRIVLHYFYSADDFKEESEVRQSTLQKLERGGLLAFNEGPVEPWYAITYMGRVYIEAVLRVPLPVQKWVMP